MHNGTEWNFKIMLKSRYSVPSNPERKGDLIENVRESFKNGFFLGLSHSYKNVVLPIVFYNFQKVYFDF